MIVYECIDPRGWGRWVIVIGFKVLLIIHYLIREILVEAILDVHERGVRIKNLSI
jgi:hypothetical protein